MVEVSEGKHLASGFKNRGFRKDKLVLLSPYTQISCHSLFLSDLIVSKALLSLGSFTILSFGIFQDLSLKI